MKIIKGYDNFFLPAEDLEKSKVFFKDQLGLEIKFEFPEKGMIAFKVADAEPAIILHHREHMKPSIMLEVDDVRQAYEELSGRGIKFDGEPYEIGTGLSVDFCDPSGNKFTLTDYSKRLCPHCSPALP